MTNDQSQLLRSFYPTFEHFCQNTLHEPPQQLEATLRRLWLPLAIQIASYRQAESHTLIQGILGGQGTGKTTLAKILSLILGHLGYRTLNLSLDDLYKTYSDRLALQQQDPRLIWRGPPGTHDIQLGLQVLDRLRQSDLDTPIEIPRFDKSAWHGAGDRGTPEIVNGADIVLFEGWFVGVRPIDPSNFDNPPPPINTCEDRQFARDINTRLQEYLPLWDKLDRLIILYPVDYRLSQQWRKDAEHQMIATGKTGMTDLQIEQFVEYFWKSLHPDLFIKPLIQDSQRVDLVIEINRDRSIGKIYHPISQHR
ncbi:glycerate kinase [Chroococcidiopsidales cyanobacterium LEGE 13417]|nr:glycerate kinase [Chroococcidiopsidales cyanobacterium LEGE 13417]